MEIPIDFFGDKSLIFISFKSHSGCQYIYREYYLVLPINMAIPVRFERTTHSLEGCCSIQLSYGTFKQCCYLTPIQKTCQQKNNILLFLYIPQRNTFTHNMFGLFRSGIIVMVHHKSRMDFKRLFRVHNTLNNDTFRLNTLFRPNRY